MIQGLWGEVTHNLVASQAHGTMQPHGCESHAGSHQPTQTISLSESIGERFFSIICSSSGKDALNGAAAAASNGTAGMAGTSIDYRTYA